MTLALALLLPLAVAMAAADAIAGEAAHGTLRGLLLAPVGRLRLVGMKAFGVLVVAVLADARDRRRRRARRAARRRRRRAAARHAVRHDASGSATRSAGSRSWPPGRSGSSPRSARWRWRSRRSPSTRWWCWPSVLGGLIVFGVLSAIPALDWLQP